MCVPGCQEAVRHALSRRGFFGETLFVKRADGLAILVGERPTIGATGEIKQRV